MKLVNHNGEGIMNIRTAIDKLSSRNEPQLERVQGVVDEINDPEVARTIAMFRNTSAERDALRRELDEMRKENDLLRHQMDFYAAELDKVTKSRDKWRRYGDRMSARVADIVTLAVQINDEARVEGERDPAPAVDDQHPDAQALLSGVEERLHDDETPKKQKPPRA